MVFYLTLSLSLTEANYIEVNQAMMSSEMKKTKQRYIVAVPDKAWSILLLFGGRNFRWMSRSFWSSRYSAVAPSLWTDECWQKGNIFHFLIFQRSILVCNWLQPVQRNHHVVQHDSVGVNMIFIWHCQTHRFTFLSDFRNESEKRLSTAIVISRASQPQTHVTWRSMDESNEASIGKDYSHWISIHV